MKIITSILKFIPTFFVPKKVINDIQINIKNVEEPYRSFINDTIKEANSLGIKVTMSTDRQVDLDVNEGTKCNGYFCSDDMELAVACGQPFNAWFSVFIHESSHMDQWNENDPTWIESSKEMAGVAVGTVMDLWLRKYVEATPEQIKNFSEATREVELNCERRTLQKIKDNNLPMDIDYYAQRANTYVWFYNIMGIVREWYTIGKEPYNIPEIVNAMPTNLNGDYSVTPPEIEELFMKYMFPEFKR